MSVRPLVLAEMVRRGQISRAAANAVTPIVVDDVAMYHDSLYDQGVDQVKMLRGLPSVPPYRQTWLEIFQFETKRQFGIDAFVAADITWAKADLQRRAMSMMLSRRGITPRFRPPTGPYTVGGMMMQWVTGTAPCFFGGFMFDLDDDYAQTSETPMLVAPHVRGLAQDQLASAIAVWMTIIHHALALFHVKNAEIVPFGNRAQRKADTRGPLGVVARELVIAPLRRTVQLVRQHQEENPGVAVPLHLCRGHFKTFTPDRPLFGKLTGTFWWEPHLRGSEHMGVVVHDSARMVM